VNKEALQNQINEISSRIRALQSELSQLIFKMTLLRWRESFK